MQPHVAVHQEQEFAAAVLKAELGAHAAGPIFDPVQAHDRDRIGFRNGDGAVGRRGVGENYLTIEAGKRRERALDGGSDVLFLIEGLDDDADCGLRVIRHDIPRPSYMRATGSPSRELTARGKPLSLQCSVEAFSSRVTQMRGRACRSSRCCGKIAPGRVVTAVRKPTAREMSASRSPQAPAWPNG